jgi:hypothetical protein
MAKVEADIPAKTDQFFDSRVSRAIRAIGQQDQNVDIGSRIKLAATIAADRDQRQVGWHIGRAPEVAKKPVNRAGAATQHGFGTAASLVGLAQPGLLGLEPGLECCDQ